MKTILVYDENIVDSLMTAACLSSIMDLGVVERKAFPPDNGDRYIWVGVIPTRGFFPFKKVWKNSSEHFVICRKSDSRDYPEILPDVVFVHSLTNNETDEVKHSCRAIPYGERTLLERSLIFFGKDPETFVSISHLLRVFQDPKAAIEDVALLVLNALRASECLEAGEVFSPLSATQENLEISLKELDKLNYLAKKKCSGSVIHDSIEHIRTKKSVRLATMYENTGWWFFKRRLELSGFKARNVSVAATGTVVYGDVVYLLDLEHLKPTYVN